MNLSVTLNDVEDAYKATKSLEFSIRTLIWIAKSSDPRKREFFDQQLDNVTCAYDEAIEKMKPIEPFLQSSVESQFGFKTCPSMHGAILNCGDGIRRKLSKPDSYGNATDGFIAGVGNIVLPDSDVTDSRLWNEKQTTQADPRISSAAQSVGGAQGDPSDPTPQDVFIFCPNGDGYHIAAFGESGHFSSRGAKGLIDIFWLISSQRTPVGMRELDGQCAVVVAGKQDAADARTLAEVEVEMQQLATEMKECTSDEARNRMRAEFDHLIAYSRTAKGIGGRNRDLNGKELTALRTRIWNRMNRLFGAKTNRTTDKMEPGTLKLKMPNTAKHLRAAITVGDDSDSYIYRPGEESIVWKTSPSDAKTH